MSKFFVDKDTFKHRMSICRDCTYYFKPTGQCSACLCFMRIKASIGLMECPKEKWSKTTEKQVKKDIPDHLIKEVEEVWDGIANGKAKDIETKRRAVELHNTIYGTVYKPTTNCASCLGDVRSGIKRIIENERKK